MIRITLLEVIAVNRDYLTQSSNMALRILSMLHRHYDGLDDEECIMSLALNDSLALMMFHADYDRAIRHSLTVLDRFPHSTHTYFIARHLAVIGRCWGLSGRSVRAQETLMEALEIGTERLPVSDSSIGLRADILHDLAMSNEMSKGDTSISAGYLHNALLLLEGTAFEGRKGTCLMGLGNIDYHQGKVETALGYYLRAADMFAEEANLHNLAAINSNIGLCYTDMGREKMAEGHLTRSLSQRLRIGNPDMIAISYFNFVRLYEQQGNMDKAISTMLTCRDYTRRSVNKYLHKMVLEWLAEKAPQASPAYTAPHSDVRYGVPSM
jgi:tetratricopeptide (TPR) repeat protein